MRTTAAAFLILAVASNALGGVDTYGSIEWRWRERALGVLPIVGGAQTTGLAPGALASTPNATNDSGNASDARFHLILEARVTRAPGVTDLQGLGAFAANAISSDLRAQGSFAGFVSGYGSEMWNAALATTAIATASPPGGSGVTLPAGATFLPNGSVSDRGLFGPFRASMNSNPRRGGIQNYSNGVDGNPAWQTLASMEQITIFTSRGPFSEVDPDTNQPGPYNGRFDFMALDAWMPVAAFTYNLLDVTTPRDITVSLNIVPSSEPSDSNIRGYRGLPNALAEGFDLWPIASAGVPDFVISVPTPGAGATLGVGALLAARRRRKA